MEQNQDSLKKVRIITYAVTALLVVAMAVGSVAFATYQRNQKLEQQKQAQIAAALAQRQIANVEAIKATLPLFRSTKQFKEIAQMAIVKVQEEDLPKTITAGLDDTVSPNPTCDLFAIPGDWNINKDGSSVASQVSPNGWSVSPDGTVSIPADAPYGKYFVSVTGAYCSDHAPDDAYLAYYYVFKIVPPCPTGVTLTH